MKRLTVYLIMILTCFTLYSKVEQVSFIYEYISDNEKDSPEEAKMKALEEAKTKALEEKYGTDISQMSATMIKNRNENGISESSSDVMMVSEMQVNGEWVQIKKEKILSLKFIEGFWHVKVEIEGKVRKKNNSEIDINAILCCKKTDERDRDNFVDGDDLYMKVTSPVSGYLAVYLVDEEQNAYCLLPYINNIDGNYKISANTEYLLFSKETDRNADEYVLTTQKNSEHNIVYIIFSPNNFTKASDNEGGVNWREEILPRMLTYKKLNSWIGKNRVRDEKMIVQKKIITISK